MGQDSKLGEPRRSDISIIYEDDVHLVVTVRVDKEWLARNIDFITGIFDFTNLIEPEI